MTLRNLHWPKATIWAMALLILGCAGGGAGPDALAFQPRSSDEVFTTADSVDMVVEAPGMGNLEMLVRTAGELAVAWEPADGGTRVQVEYLRFEGDQTNPLGAPTRVVTGDIEGDLVFTVDRLGRPTVVTSPQVTTGAARLANPQRLAHTFLPRLPGRAVNPGDTWVDTVRFETEETGWKLSAVYELTYTLQGDTVLNGESLLHITSAGEADYSAEGQLAGFEIAQTLTGDVTEDILWHPVESSLISRRALTDLDGDIEVPGIGSLGLRWSERSHTSRARP